MIRAFVLFFIIVLVSLGFVWVANQPGNVTMVWLDHRIDMPVSRLIAGVAILSVALAVVWRTFGAVRSVVARTGSVRVERRRHRGYKALTRGFVAVAAGDVEEASKQAERADVLLADPPLTMLLSAQAAQLSGDQKAAQKYFVAMLDRPDTAFLGLRGLINQALRDHNRDEALILARRAYRLRPKTPWLVAMLSELLSQTGLWAEAAAVLHAAARHRTLPDARQREAVALFGQSQRARIEGRPGESLDLLRRAHKLSPDNVPIAAKLASVFADQGKRRRARKILEAAWAQGPHPDLARAFATLSPGEEPLARLQRSAILVKLRPEHAETHIAVAEAALDAQLWGEARRHLRLALLAPNPGRRVFRLMATLEEKESEDLPAARQWLAKAAETGPDPAWVCRRCAASVPDWQPLCPACDAFDELAWTSPARPILGSPASPVAPAVPFSPGHA